MAVEELAMIRSAVTDQPGRRGPRRAVRLLGRPARRLPQGEGAGLRRRRGLPARRPTRSTPATLRTLLDDHGLALAAVGTGAGWVKHRLHLRLPDAAARGQGARLHPLDHRLRRAARRPGDHRLDAGPQRRRRRSRRRPLGYLRRGPRGPRRARRAVRRPAALRAAEPLRDEPGQHGRGGRRRCSSRCRRRTSCCWPTCST